MSISPPIRIGPAPTAANRWCPGKVDISYLGSSFPVDLLQCPRCGLVLIPEELAMGKMNEVEKALEDK